MPKITKSTLSDFLFKSTSRLKRNHFAWSFVFAVLTVSVLCLLYWWPKEYTAGRYAGETGSILQNYEFISIVPNDPGGSSVKVHHVPFFRGKYTISVSGDIKDGSSLALMALPDNDSANGFGAFIGKNHTKMSFFVQIPGEYSIIIHSEVGTDALIRSIKIQRDVIFLDVVLVLCSFLIIFIAALLLSQIHLPFILITIYILLALFHFYNSKWSLEISGNYTDHISHLNAARVAILVGTDIYTKTIDSIFTELGMFGNGLHQRIGWSLFPRAYPPGVYLLHIPFATLIDIGIDHDTIALILPLVYLVFTCLLLHDALKRVTEQLDNKGPRTAAIALLFIPMAQWTLFGFYDAIAVYCIYISLVKYADKRFGTSFLFFSFALLLHYRSLWYIFFGALTFGSFLTIELRQKGLGLRNSAYLLGGLAVSAASFASFLTLLPLLQDFSGQSALNIAEALAQKQFPLIFILYASALFCGFRKKIVPSACLLGFAILLTFTKQLYPWHSTFVMPLILFILISKEERCYTPVLLSCLTIALCAGKLDTSVFGSSLIITLYNKAFMTMTNYLYTN
jgi:hypothetical protein